MKVIIAGGRLIEGGNARGLVSFAVYKSGWQDSISEVVSGVCRGIDIAGKEWADVYELPVKPFPYKRWMGRAGGPVRNREMAIYADRLIAIWDGASMGTMNMIDTMAELKKPAFVMHVRKMGDGIWTPARWEHRPAAS